MYSVENTKTFEQIVAQRKAMRKNWGKDIRHIEYCIPEFLKNLEAMYSPSLSASRAGFNWQTWRNAILQRPDIREKYDTYMEESEYRKRGLMGGL